MKRKYRENQDYIIVEESEKFGIEDSRGHLLLPIEYDSISVSYGTAGRRGFILCQNSRFGYAEFGNRECLAEYEYGVVLGVPNGCALAFLPCIFSRMDRQRNGLVLFLNTEEGEQECWYDFKSRELHRDLRWMGNFVDYDSFLIDHIGPCMPMLKKAGEDAWVKFPGNRGVDPWREIPTDQFGVRCILCCEEIPKYVEGDDGTIEGYAYFFLLLFKNGWVSTPAETSLAKLYEKLPVIIEGIDRVKKGNATEKDRLTYQTLCAYKKKNEEEPK